MVQNFKQLIYLHHMMYLCLKKILLLIKKKKKLEIGYYNYQLIKIKILYYLLDNVIVVIKFMMHH